MYTGMYKSKGNKNMYMKLIVVAIISFTMGALVVGGQGDGTLPTTDVDNIKIVPLRAYVDAPASNIYYELTGDHFTDIGNKYDRCAMATYDVANLEVNRITCSIEISYIDAMMFIVRINETEDGYTELAQFQNNETIIQKQISIPADYDIAVIVFYYGLRMVTIESIFDYR